MNWEKGEDLGRIVTKEGVTKGLEKAVLGFTAIGRQGNLHGF